MGEPSSGQPRAPKLNKFMHIRNPYRTPPSFKQLATQYPDFRKFCNYDLDGKVRLDFTQPRALAELAIALMHKDFGLTVTLPPHKLVPTIPLRLNYLLWLQDLVGLWAPRVKEEEFNLQEAVQLQQQQKEDFQQMPQAQQQSHTEQEKGEVKNKKLERTQYVNPVIGVDIGCGASCVYGLLGARHCGWHMVATDTDTQSLQHATSNVTANGMNDEVHTMQGSADSLFGVLDSPKVLEYIAGVRQQKQQDMMDTDSPAACDSDGYLLDLSMCNPPFFSSEHDADSTTKTKKHRGPPPNAYTGMSNETIYEGGEVAFIAAMIQESIKYKHKIRLFSTLVGTAADMRQVKRLLTTVSPASFVVTEFCQGRTMRWGVAWTWCPSLPLRCVVSAKQSSNSKPLVMRWPRRSCLAIYSVPAAWEAVNGWLNQIKLKPKVFKTTKYFIGATVKAYKETWKNQRQQRREEQRRQMALASAGESATPNISSNSNNSGTSSSGNNSGTSSSCPTSDCGLSSPHNKRLHDDDHTETTHSKRQKSNDTSDDEDSDSEVEDDCANDEGGATTITDDNNCAMEVEQTSVNGSDPINGSNNGTSDVSSLVNNGGTDGKTKKTVGKPCLLKVNIFMKLINNQVWIEFHVLGGLLGRDAANQLLTFITNKLQRKE